MEKEEQKLEDIAKITVSKESEEAVSKIVVQINDGFVGGRVNRQDVCSYLLLRACQNFSDDELNLIRSQFTNDVALLEAMLKKARETGKVPDSIREALMTQMGLGSAPKRNKKILQDKYSNAISENKETL